MFDDIARLGINRVEEQAAEQVARDFAARADNDLQSRAIQQAHTAITDCYYAADSTLARALDTLDVPGIAENLGAVIQTVPGNEKTQVEVWPFSWAPATESTASYEAALQARPWPEEVRAMRGFAIGCSAAAVCMPTMLVVGYQRTGEFSASSPRLAVVSAEQPLYTAADNEEHTFDALLREGLPAYRAALIHDFYNRYAPFLNDQDVISNLDLYRAEQRGDNTEAIRQVETVASRLYYDLSALYCTFARSEELGATGEILTIRKYQKLIDEGRFQEVAEDLGIKEYPRELRQSSVGYYDNDDETEGEYVPGDQQPTRQHLWSVGENSHVRNLEKLIQAVRWELPSTGMRYRQGDQYRSNFKHGTSRVAVAWDAELPQGYDPRTKFVGEQCIRGLNMATELPPENKRVPWLPRLKRRSESQPLRGTLHAASQPFGFVAQMREFIADRISDVYLPLLKDQAS